MKFPIFGLSASVDNRPLTGAWVVLGVQDHKKIKFLMATRPLAVKGLKNIYSTVTNSHHQSDHHHHNNIRYIIYNKRNFSTFFYKNILYEIIFNIYEALLQHFLN